MDLKQLIYWWEEHGDSSYNGVIYISDLQFEEYFTITHIKEYISTLFEFLDGEFGFVRTIQYNNFPISDDPLYINYETLEMSSLSNVDCLNVKALKDYKLTIFNSSYLITTSEYLKPICILLFSTYRSIEGICYVCNNLIKYISYILPQFIILKKQIECDKLSLPFSLSFITQINCKIKYFHSQIDNTTYKLCLNEN